MYSVEIKINCWYALVEINFSPAKVAIKQKYHQIISIIIFKSIDSFIRPKKQVHIMHNLHLDIFSLQEIRQN